MREWACVNGTLLPAEDAQISVFDSAFMQGIGLFETMRSYGGCVFRMERHLDRLRVSAQQLGWSVVPDVDELADHVHKVVGACEGQDARVRLTVTTGSLRASAAAGPELTIVATAASGGAYPPEHYERGVAVSISRYRQNRLDPTTGFKTTSYFARLASLREAHAAGAFEALWFTVDGFLAEGAISSVFLVRDETLLTPPLNTPVLPGISRATVLELAAQAGVAAEERPLRPEDVEQADELFLTNSMMEVMPVVLVERDVVGAGTPGGLTGRFMEAYRALVKEECQHGEA